MKKIFLLLIFIFYTNICFAEINDSQYIDAKQENSTSYNEDLGTIQKKIKNSSLEIQKQKKEMEKKFNDSTQKMQENSFAKIDMPEKENLNINNFKKEIEKIKQNNDIKEKGILIKDNDEKIEQEDTLTTKESSINNTNLIQKKSQNLSFYISLVSLVIFIIMIVLFIADRKKQKKDIWKL